MPLHCFQLQRFYFQGTISVIEMEDLCGIEHPFTYSMHLYVQLQTIVLESGPTYRQKSTKVLDHVIAIHCEADRHKSNTKDEKLHFLFAAFEFMREGLINQCQPCLPFLFM